MYNLPLPKLCPTLLVASQLSWSNAQVQMQNANVPALYCVMPYIAACVDVSGTVLLGHSVLHLPVKALILVEKLLNKLS